MGALTTFFTSFFATASSTLKANASHFMASLQRLRTHFLDNIRSYNGAFAMASSTAQFVKSDHGIQQVSNKKIGFRV
jgi:hypothetical protein